MRIGALLIAALLLGACDDGDAAEPVVDVATPDAVADAVMEASVMPDGEVPLPEDAGPDAAPASGTLWRLEIDVSGLGPTGYLWQAETWGDAPAGGPGRFERVVLRLLVEEGPVDLVEVEDVAVDAEGRFIMDTIFTLAAEHSPIGAELTYDLSWAGEVREGLVCGTVGGSVVGINIDGSTFGMVPWEGEEGPVQPSCEAPAPPLEPIEVCPALASGRVADFPSGGVDREFELILPPGYDAGEDWPLLFAFHGLNMTIEQMVAPYPEPLPVCGEDVECPACGEGLPACPEGQLCDPVAGGCFLVPGAEVGLWAEELGAIVVVPQARSAESETAGWLVAGDPESNPDLRLFDDLLFCLDEHLSIDAERIGVTGISNGAIFTSYLVDHRSDRLAAAAPSSGGLPTFDPGAVEPRIPFLLGWGGETDVVLGIDFHTASLEGVRRLRAAGWLVVACNHGMGHSYPPAWHRHIARFLLEHRRGAPSPFAEALPEDFPDFCGLE